PVQDLAGLREQGYDAVLVATGTPRSTRLDVPGEELRGVLPGLEFLRTAKLGQPTDLTGKRVVVIGGGNVAMDAARTAQRLGARSTTVLYRRGREEMPAHSVEVDDAEKEGVAFRYLVAPVAVEGDGSGAVSAITCTRMALGAVDPSGRRRPEPVSGSESSIPCDVVIVAIGMAPETAAFAQMVPVEARSGRLRVDAATLQSGIPYIFAAGDVVSGATDITRAVGEGRKAAFMIDRWLQEGELAGFDDRVPVVDKAQVLARQANYARREPTTPDIAFSAMPRDFAELESPMTEAEAHDAAARCMDCGVCSECGECLAACPADAIDLRMHEHEFDVEVGAVVVSTGFKLFAADLKPQYGYGTFKNVITGMQMDRLLAPTRPFNTILRPGDGKVPERIAYVMCTGSRDETVGNPLCSRFCCMYSIKQNQLLMGALPLADVTVHYMDIRAAGKRYDEFYEQAKSMGATYVKGRVAKITEKEGGDLILRYEDIEHGGALVEADYDLVVLAVGVQPNSDAQALFPEGDLSLDEFRYVAEPDEDLNPGQTSIPGVFVAGAASGAKDIADSILHAGSTVAQVAAHLEAARLERVEVPA
ncbi:MAG: FAD-dependent oxidoreductase, partial [Candidatus Limnocylindrales bacterium]